MKATVALLPVVPLAADVVGSLAPSAADDDDRSRPVIIGSSTQALLDLFSARNVSDDDEMLET